MNAKLFIFSLRLGFRQARAGKWTIIFFALLLAVSAFSAQYFLSERLQQVLNTQAAMSLGGDIALISPRPILKTWRDKAEALQLRHAETLKFTTALVSGDTLQFATIQAVSKNFPLLGSNISKSPEKGFVWVDKRLYNKLYKNNDVQNNVQIGVAHFKVLLRPDENEDILSGLSFAPHVIMNLEDIEKTKTILPGSQVEYRLLLAGDADQIKKYQLWINTQLQPDQKLWNVHDQSTLAINILKQAIQYLGLVIIICLIIAGVALLMGTQRYIEQQHYTIALLRCLGLQQKNILKILLIQLASLGLISGILGVIIGYSLQFLLLKFLNHLLPLLSAGKISFLPMIMGITVSFVLLIALSLPLLIKLSRASALFLWRNEKNLTLNFSWIIFSIIIITACILFYLLIPHLIFILWLLNTLTVIIAMFYFLIYIIFRVIFYNLDHLRGVLRLAGLNILRHEAHAYFYMISFSIIIMAVLVLYAVRGNLFSAWQAQLPENTPNYFAFNIAPDQVTAVSATLAKLGAKTSGIYPMVRGRLIFLNHKPILEAVLPSGRNQNALYRELNLSWMLKFPRDNKIVAGTDWNEKLNHKSYISIEKNLADNLGIKLGDQLTFQIGDQQLTGEVNNMRSLNWQSFHPNFYIVFPPGILERFPQTYITSFYVSENQKNQLNQLTQQFPNMTLIDASVILSQAKTLLDQAITAMQYAFILTLVGGIILLSASIQMTLSTREQAYRLMRILGADKLYLQRSLLSEFCVTGLLSGLMGALCAELISWGIAHYGLGIPYKLNLYLYLWGSLLGLVCLTLPALVFTRKIVNTPPLLKE